MTILEAIGKADELKPNQYTQKQKIEWLSRCDGMIYRLILENYEGYAKKDFAGYGSNDGDTVLLVPFPFDNIYVFWLKAQIDLANEEIGKYNNDITEYNALYQEYADYIIRTHSPKKKTALNYI